MYRSKTIYLSYIAKLWNQVPSLDHFVVQNSGNFLCWKYKEVVFIYVSNLRQLSATEKSTVNQCRALYIFNRENPQNSEPQNCPRRVLDFIDLRKSEAWNSITAATLKAVCSPKMLLDNSSHIWELSSRWLPRIRNGLLRNYLDLPNSLWGNSYYSLLGNPCFMGPSKLVY